MVITSTLDMKFLLNVFEMIKVFIILEYEKNTKTKAKPNQHSYMNFAIFRNHDLIGGLQLILAWDSIRNSCNVSFRNLPTHAPLSIATARLHH